MGLLKHKNRAKKPSAETVDQDVQHYFDAHFEQLREQAQATFEETINDRAAKFSGDLDATINRANSQLKEHIATQLNTQFIENSKAMKETEDQALESLTRTVQTIEQQHTQLGAAASQAITDQGGKLNDSFNELQSKIDSIKSAGDQAIESMNRTAETLEQQQKQLSEAMQGAVAKQAATLVKAFEENMAHIIEQYLLSALGDQYDLKAQLPAIISQMEDNKQDIMEDMKL